MPPAPRAAWSIPGWQSERPLNDPAVKEIWCYTDRFSYDPGEQVAVHVHTTADTYDLRIVRDGAEPTTVLLLQDLPGEAHPTPDDAYAVGCGWPVARTIPVDPAWTSGFYLVIVGITDEHGRRHEREHFFVVRSPHPTARTALILTTSTMLAYNDWGGANAYRGLGDDPYTDIPTPQQSALRPIARGMLRKPEDAPRNRHTHRPPIGWQPRHQAYEWAHANGYSRHHADALWATYERPFVVWAEQHGHRLDYLTQHDLHFAPERLDGYDCAVIVGHDEYWTREMRDAIDTFVDRGGNLARFGGNYIWQVRLEDDGATQVCYKIPGLDPVNATDPHLDTTAWDHPKLDRPGAATMGLTGLGGVYARYGSATPRSSGGYTVYRPHHWAFEGTDLYYGDVFGGDEACIVSFEVDGVDYTFRKGLPYPTGEDGAPDDLEILAMAPAVVGETDRWQGRVPLGAAETEALLLTEVMYDGNPPEFRRDARYGAAMIGVFTRGAGTVFNAGTCEWISGLIHHDPFTERITDNVLRRLTGEKR
ncbi:N,N-dimethylformamidase beta subunit family domain-containing protein [Streptomyces sp. NPDC004667]|uniref:N,N-dimethylformamidase beta subunit family domain-containing protein n=1 Tax=Streptomyces sp. NPDC004667 TaxID=3154285 RepID=UPI0033BD971E